MKIRATVKGEKIICDRSLWLTYLSGLQGDVSVEIKRYKKDRTYDQNRLYWKYISIIADETGDNTDDLHSYFKRKFLSPRFVKVLGRDIKLPASTTKLNTKEMSEYIDKICALTNINIPNKDLC